MSRCTNVGYPQQQMVDTRSGLRRNVHAVARRDNCQRCPKEHPGRPPFVVQRLAVGGRCLALTLPRSYLSSGRWPTYLVDVESSWPALFCLALPRCRAAWPPLRYSLMPHAPVQGIGAAAMFATGLALLAQEFRGKERGTAFGIWGAVTGAAVAVGPLVGGALTDGLGWESIFFVNVPVGIAAFVLTITRVQDAHEETLALRSILLAF